jgi:ABC-type branched-subunit amino acid transport system substrate-binding protein
VNRRQLIRGIGAAGIAGLAGCTGDGNGDGGGDGEDGGGDGEDGGGDGSDGSDGGSTPTATMTEAMTESMGRDIRVGILMGVTGALAELGPPIRNAAELAADTIDQESDAFSVDYQFEDTATSPDTGISGAESLINAGYPAIAGALSSSVTLQVARQQAVPNGVVQCSPASTSPEITGLDDNDYLYRTTPDDRGQSEVMTRVGRERLEAETTSIIALNNAYGQGLADAYASVWESAGGTVQAQVSYEKGQSSYTSQVTEALADEPDLLMIVGYPGNGQQIFRDFYAEYSQDFCDIIVPDGLQSEDLPGDVGNSMRNVWGTAPSTIGPGVDAFQSLYEDAYDSDPSASPFTAQSFDAVAVLALANAAAGENDGEAVRDEMRNVANEGGEEVTPDNLAEGIEMAASGTEINYQGAAGVIEFDDNGDIGSATYQLFRYQEGGFENVDELDYTAE